jgi:hypothetical protein
LPPQPESRKHLRKKQRTYGRRIYAPTKEQVMKANALGLIGVAWLWIASGCDQATPGRNSPDANDDGRAADGRSAGGAGGYLAGTGGATSLGGTTAPTGGAGGSGGKDAGEDISVVEQEAGRDAGAKDVGADGGSALVCNGSLLPGGLPTSRIGFYPVTAVAGDLNGDGKLDLLTAGTLDGLSVLLGQGDGSFAAGQTLGDGPWGVWGPSLPMADPNGDVWGPSLALADLNGDGHLDLVTVKGPNVRLGKGDGTFAEAVSYPTADPSSIALGDLNGDGHLDIIAANNGAGTVSVLLGKGDGTFAASVDYPAGDKPWLAVVGDLDGDGASDLVVVAEKAANVLLGKGDGTLGTRVEIQSPLPGSTQVPSGALGDLNGDGKLDLLVGWGNGLVYILLGEGDGRFGASRDSDGGGSVCSLLDLNGDGKLDLVTPYYVQFGKGDGSFGYATSYTTGTGEVATFAVPGDFNGDGLIDLAVTFGSSPAGWVRVLLGTGGGAFSQTPEYSTGDGVNVNAFALGDLDGDGILDLATASEAQHGVPKVGVLRGRGGGTFAAKRDFDAYAAMAIALGDLNGDGKLDIVTSEASVLLNRGDGTFTSHSDYYRTRTDPVSLALGDLDGDRKLDIVRANGGSLSTGPVSSISVLLGQGDGAFAPNTDYATSSSAEAVALGDLNGDGKLDVVVANHGGASATQSVSVLLGRGDGTFSAKVDYPSQYPPISEYDPISLALGDLNGDGRLDIIWGPDAKYLGVLLGKGDGTFADPVWYMVQDGAAALALGDMNRDGKPDLVATIRGGTVCLLLGRGDGTLADAIYYPAVSWSSLALADLNADGKLEVIATGSEGVFVLSLCH